MHHNKMISNKPATIKRGSGIASLITKAVGKIPVGDIVNTAIDSLPIELHIGQYQYCGPGTKLEKRLARGDPGINKLDQACKEHDIAYSKYTDSANRSIADRALAEKAWQRVRSSDANLGERATALAVAAAMKAKTTFGGGCTGQRKSQKRRNKNKKKTGGKIRRRKQNKKKSINKKNLWSIIRSGKGLYLKPYNRVY